VAPRRRRDRTTMAVGLIMVLIIALAVFAPWVATHDPLQGSVLRRLKPIGTPGFFLGTDETGRDIWSRLVYGGRLSLICGITPVLGATCLGGFLGLLAGIGGRLINTLIMRVVDVFYAFPSVLLAIAICGVLGAGIGNTLLSLTVVFAADGTRDRKPDDTGEESRFRRSGARQCGTDARYHPSAGLAQRAGRHAGLRDEPRQHQHHPLGGPVVPRPWRDSTPPGMGADAERAASSDLR